MDVTKIDTRIAASMVATMSDALRTEIDAALHDYGWQVTQELSAIAAYHDVDVLLHAQTCIVFSILSPRCKFEKNVRATRRFMNALDQNFATIDEVYQCITDNGNDSWFSAGGAARSLFASHAWIRSMSVEDMNKQVLLSLNRAGIVKGLARKTASMAIALFDAYAPVFTIDTHMMRGLLTCANMNPVGDLNINDSAYDLLEAACLNVIDSMMNGAPSTYFLVQWALWDRWGFSQHVTHLPIFSDYPNDME